MGILEQRSTRLAIILSGIFLTNIFIAEFIGVKIFSFEDSIGIKRFAISLFGQNDMNFELTAGVLLWPVVFVLTDIINEYFGRKGVQFLSWLGVILISYSFLMFYIGMKTVPASWWTSSKTEQGVPDLNLAFNAIFGQGLWIIIGSIIAFLVGQIIDVFIFQQIKRKMGEKKLWIRSTVSTIVSQFIDSYIVLLIAFYLGAGWDIKLVLAIGTKNYIYKFIMAILMIPIIYLFHYFIEKYLGKEEAKRLKMKALAN